MVRDGENRLLFEGSCHASQESSEGVARVATRRPPLPSARAPFQQHGTHCCPQHRLKPCFAPAFIVTIPWFGFVTVLDSGTTRADACATATRSGRSTKKNSIWGWWYSRSLGSQVEGEHDGDSVRAGAATDAACMR